MPVPLFVCAACSCLRLLVGRNGIKLRVLHKPGVHGRVHLLELEVFPVAPDLLGITRVDLVIEHYA